MLQTSTPARAQIFLLAASLIGLAALPVWAAAPLKVGQLYARVTGNVTGASNAQSVSLKLLKVQVIGAEDAAWSAQLVLSSPNGKTLWQGPTVPTGPFAFQGGPAGETSLQVAGPFERFGQGEVVVKEMQSDVRVEHYRVLRWNGRALTFVRSSGLVETPAKSGRFVWNADQTPRSR